MKKESGFLRMGFFKRSSHDIISTKQCEILPDQINKIKEWKDGAITRGEFVNYITDREANKRMPECTIDISTFNHFFADILLDISTDSKFILTIRDVESWFISVVNWMSGINCITHRNNDLIWFEDYMRFKQKGEYDMFMTIVNNEDDLTFDQAWRRNDFEFVGKLQNHNAETLLNSSMMEDILDYYYESNKKVIDLIPKERLLIFFNLM